MRFPFSSPIENEPFSPGLESICGHAQSVGEMVIHFLVTVRNVRLHAQQFSEMLNTPRFNLGSAACPFTRCYNLSVILNL